MSKYFTNITHLPLLNFFMAQDESHKHHISLAQDELSDGLALTTGIEDLLDEVDLDVWKLKGEGLGGKGGSHIMSYLNF